MKIIELLLLLAYDKVEFVDLLVVSLLHAEISHGFKFNLISDSLEEKKLNNKIILSNFHR